MITVGNVTEICGLINDASTKITIIIGEEVELRLVKPEIIGSFARKLSVDVQREITINIIIEIVCSRYMVTRHKIKSSHRGQNETDARKLVCYLLSKIVDVEAYKIASELKCSVAMANYWINKAKVLIDTDANFRFHLNETLKELKQNINLNY
ncbi:MAG: hypothetical protein ACXVAY_01560 [Mucilaginibacter sp.]